MDDCQAESQFEYQDASGPKKFIQQVEQDFAQPFMVEPYVVRESIIVWVGFWDGACLPNIFAKFEMAP